MAVIAVLDLVRIKEGGGAREALDDARELAGHAERLGYGRFWMAEHHNMPGTASAATSLAIAHVAAGTRTIRVGAGGVMLPNHSPLVIAEQFGTLEALFPNRIDLGLGRAPGGDLLTMRALRRDPRSAEHFPQDVLELQALLGPERPAQHVRAFPGIGTAVPLWILGSSLHGAQLAAHLGLPFAFAAHFAPAALLPAFRIYRERFKPSRRHPRPWAALSVNVVAAKDDRSAQRLATTQQMAVVDIFRGELGASRPPIDDIDTYWTGMEKQQSATFLSRSITGAPGTVRDRLAALIAETRADELLIVSDIFDMRQRIDSLEITADVLASLPADDARVCPA